MELVKEKDFLNVKFLMGGSANRVFNFPCGSQIIFFNNQQYLLKHKEEIEFALANPNLFEVVAVIEPEEDEEPKEPEEPTEVDRSEGLPHSKKELIEKPKSELIDILKRLGAEKIPRLTRNKISLILELQEPKEK